MLTLTIKRPGSLESVLLSIEITEDEAAKVEDMFRDRDKLTGLVVGDTVRMSSTAPAWRDDPGTIVDFAGTWAHVRFARSFSTVTRVRVHYLVLVNRTSRERLINGRYRIAEDPGHANHVANDTID